MVNPSGIIIIIIIIVISPRPKMDVILGIENSHSQ
jgi:hypothetical protein